MEVSGDEHHVRDLVVINELEELRALSGVAFVAVFTTKDAKVLDRLRAADELPEDASGLGGEKIRLELRLLGGTKERAARGEGTDQEVRDLRGVGDVADGRQRSTAEAAGVEHEGRSSLALHAVAVEIQLVRGDRIARGTIVGISDGVILAEGLRSVEESLGVVDVSAGVAAEAGVCGAESTAREVVSHFMVINHSEDRRRGAEISEGVQAVAAGIHFVEASAVVSQ